MVTHFFVQNQQSADLLSKIGLTNITITGDTRFDRVAEIASKSKDLPKIEQFKNGGKLIVAGSTWSPDEALLIKFLKQNPTTKIVIAPHEVKESNILRLVKQLPIDVALYSQSEGLNLALHHVLVIDTIGLLSSIYRYADLAYIGGGFGMGIHNTLEAAIYNIPILFGPNYLKFLEAVNLVKVGAAFPIANYEELRASLNKLLGDEKSRESIAKKSHEFMAKNLGATQQILEKVFNIT
jgi:3-deoxy-D-manno-octulosonic-acid transferase